MRNNMFMSKRTVATMERFIGTSNRVQGRRAFIKQLLDRQTSYRASDYIRKLRNDRNIQVTERELFSALNRMARAGQLVYTVVQGKIVGHTL